MSVAATLVVACSSSDNADQAGDDKGEASTSSVAVPEPDLVLAVGDEAVAQLDERYQSYNVEMVEVTGGYFWAPYEAEGARVYRPPIDLTSERLRNLARELGPVYIRVSGTWANST